jgi:predicted glycogen debranching enzyme
MLSKDKNVLRNFPEAIQHEWLETNGLGGWAGSSLTGANTRRYHGLLVAAIKPPTERMVLLSKLDETIVTGNKRIELGSNIYEDGTIYPTGHQYLSGFSRDFFPVWIYEAEGIVLKKTIGMVHGENTVVIIYDVIKAPASFTLELLPLIAARGYHSLQYAGEQIHWDAEFNHGLFHNRPDNKTDLFIKIPGAVFESSPRWFHHFHYPVERYRGLDHTEDLFNHGVFSVPVKEGDSIGIIISAKNPRSRNAHELFEKENARRRLLLTGQPDDQLIQQLVLAADQFIVKRTIKSQEESQIPIDIDIEGATIIAGYHWFTDWGRDTMISLPGLCLSTGRHDDARKIIAAFAKSVSMGMLPNRFQDNGEDPEYNNVDGTLWYFIAVYKYLQVTKDRDFVLIEILPVLKQIIDWHFKGTRYNIHVADDGLLYAGETGQQLTWMDARIGDWVVTPRMGKAVEIQALWYNSLRIFAELLEWNYQDYDAHLVKLSAEKAKESFMQKFWYEKGGYLYDVIDEKDRPDHSLRPNQLFAISLPFPLIEGEQAKAVFKIVQEKLYTPVGLRSLPQDDPAYVHNYGGSAIQRDSSYHQGTVWSWLLGPYIDVMVKANQDRSSIETVINNFKCHLNEACIGSVSEIFDADSPHHPRGCVAQAWGVAELLRVIKDYHLFNGINKNTREKAAIATN